MKIKSKTSNVFSVFTKSNFIVCSIIISVIILLYLLINYSFLEISVNYLIWAIVISTLMFFLIIFFFLKMKRQNYTREINRELPFFLNNLSADLEKNIALRTALENRIDNSIIGEKLNVCLYRVDKLGYSLKDALYMISTDNEDLGRAIYQIQDIIASGNKNKAQALRTLSNSFIEKQNYKIKNYSTKLNLISLIFIVVSAILPAMFLIFLLVGSNFLEISFTPFSIVLITVILFPVIDMFLLLFMKANVP